MDYFLYSGIGIFYFFTFLLGLALGSFLNSLIWRTRENIRIVKGRSICPKCRRQLTWYENIPVISYIFLGGKCRTCKNEIPWYYTAVEAGTALIFLLVAWLHMNYMSFTSAHFLRDLFFAVLLIVIFAYDLLYEVILPGIVWFGVIAGFIINYFFLNYGFGSLLIGLAVGGGFFLLQYAVSKGRWIGGGDVRMGIMMGVWLGWPSILVALAIAYIVGSIISLLLICLKKKNFASTTPFGTYLAIGTFAAMFCGTAIINWYLGYLR